MGTLMTSEEILNDQPVGTYMIFVSDIDTTYRKNSDGTWNMPRYPEHRWPPKAFRHAMITGKWAFS